MVSTKQKSRKMKMGTRTKKSNRSRKQRGGQTSTMSESTSSMPESSSSTSSMPESSSSTSSMPEITSTMPELSSSTSTMSTSTSPTTTSRVSKLPMSFSRTTSTKPTPTSTVPLKKVDIYFKLEGGKPKFVSSSDAGITVGGTSTGTATIKINPSLGKLHDYSGSGWTQANKWVPLDPDRRIDKPTSALRLAVVNTNNLIRKIGGKLILPNQIKLPSLLSAVDAKGLEKATFGIGTNPGDPKNGNAVILITLMFA